MPDQAGTGTHDNATTLTALTDAAERTARMLRTVPDGAARVPGLEWTAAETAAHLLGELTHYTGYLTGQRNARDYLETDSAQQTAAQRNAAANARQLREFTDRDMSRLADSILAATQGFTAAAAGHPDSDSALVSNGMTITVPVMTAALLGEHVVHGLDITRAAGLPWIISREDANLVLGGVLAMVPGYVDRKAAMGRHLSYELRLRGGPGYRLSFDDGTLTVGEPGQKADCVISADPVAFLLVGFGRTGQWGPIMRGKMVASGRKPWLGFSFGRLLLSP